MYSFVHSLKTYCIVKLKNCLLNDSVYTVRYVGAINILIFQRNDFKMWFCLILKYQNHKTPLKATLPKVWYILPLHLADRINDI